MFSIFKKNNNTSYQTLKPEKANNALVLLFFLSAVGISATILYSLRWLDQNSINFGSSVTVACIGLLIASAAFSFGLFGGFIFGIPKSISQPNAAGINYIDNDNLVQISDWLTKIIVGVGLTQLVKIPGYLDRLGNYLKVSLGDDEAAKVTSEAIVVYFLICGFLLSYLWTRLYFKQMLNYADSDNDAIIKDKQKRESEFNEAIDPYTDGVGSSDPTAFKKIVGVQENIAEKEGTQSVDNSNIISYKDFSTLVDKAKKAMDLGKKAQNTLPDDQKDPNKNQWGGKSELNERKLTASVEAFDGGGLFKISLLVMSTNTSIPILDGEIVLFSLHDSFKDPFKLVMVKNGVAKLEIISYGAFTVGVYIYKENVELELDLSELKGAPKEFREN